MKTTLTAGAKTYEVQAEMLDALTIEATMPWTDGKDRMIQGHYFKCVGGDKRIFRLRKSGRWIIKGDVDDGHRLMRLHWTYP